MKNEMKPMDAVEFIRKYAFRIIAASIACGIVAAVYCVFVLDNYYTARGQILVMSPKYMEELTLAPERPGIRTYDSMLSSDEILWTVFARLKEVRKGLNDSVVEKWSALVKDATSAKQLLKCTDAAAEWAKGLSLQDARALNGMNLEEFENQNFVQFRKSFDSSFDIDKETNIELLYSPLLKLNSESTDPRLSAMMCNLWMDVFVAKMHAVTTAQTKDVVDSIVKDFEEVGRKLKDSDRRIQEWQAKYNTDLLENELKAKKEILTGGEQRSVTSLTGEEREAKGKKDDLEEGMQTSIELVSSEGPRFTSVMVEQQSVVRLLSKEEQTLQTLDDEIRRMESEDGNWLGTIANPTDLGKELVDTETRIAEIRRISGNSGSSIGLGVSVSPESATHEWGRPGLAILTAKKEYIEASLRIADFTRRTELDAKFEREISLKESVGILQRAGLVGSVSAAAYEQQSRELRETVAALPKVVRLRETLPLDVVVSAFGVNPEAAGLVGMATVERWIEKESPEYVETAKHQSGAESSAALFRARSEAIDGTIEAYSADLAQVSAENLLLRSSLALLYAARDLAEDRLNDVRTKYMESRSKRFETLVRISRLRGINSALTRESAGLIADITKTENLLKERKVELAVFEREQATLQDSYDVMAEKVKESRLQATSVPEDVRIAARAVAPDRKSGPFRALIVLTTVVFSCVFFVLIFLIWEFIILRPEHA